MLLHFLCLFQIDPSIDVYALDKVPSPFPSSYVGKNNVREIYESKIAV